MRALYVLPSLMLLCGGAVAPGPRAQTVSVPPEHQVEYPVQLLAPTIAVLGAEMRDAQGDMVGRIVDILVDPDGHPRAAVVDFGGFMGVGSRRVAIDWALLTFARDSHGPVLIDLTADQLRAAPAYRDSRGPVAVLAPPVVPTPMALPKPPAEVAPPDLRPPDLRPPDLRPPDLRPPDARPADAAGPVEPPTPTAPPQEAPGVDN